MKKAVAKIEAELAELPAIAKPWPEMTDPEQLRHLTRLSMERTRGILLRDIDYTDPTLALKRERLIGDLALGLLSRQIRVDEARYRDQKDDQTWTEIQQAIDRYQKLNQK